jgi:hypothetical protein
LEHPGTNAPQTLRDDYNLKEKQGTRAPNTFPYMSLIIAALVMKTVHLK